MANTRLYRGSVRIGLAFPEAFANWQTPTSAELNATNGLVFDLTCALAEGGTKFDLGDSDSDNTLTFCSVAGETNYTFYNPDIAFEFNRSSDPTASNQANIAFGLLAFPDIEYFAWMRIGKANDAPFAAGDVVSLVRVDTDYSSDNVGSGNNATGTSALLPNGDVLWNYTLAS
jgi:hypothetical protein